MISWVLVALALTAVPVAGGTLFYFMCRGLDRLYRSMGSATQLNVRWRAAVLTMIAIVWACVAVAVIQAKSHLP